MEFADKRVARRVADTLNGQQIGARSRVLAFRSSPSHASLHAGGPRRSAFHYDLWNIKYLSKFKWEQLTEEVAHAKAVREQRLALELSAAKRERDFYLKQVEASKAVEGAEARRARRAERALAAAQDGGGAPPQPAAPPAAAAAAARPERAFAQRPVRRAEGGARVSNATLRSVFGRNTAEPDAS